MSQPKSKIEWTDSTWNPVTGCDRISPGCDNCYAATMAARLKKMGSPRYQRDSSSGPGFGVTIHPDALDQPFRWRKPRRIFVNSMSDLFHQEIPASFIAEVFAVMALADQHRYQVLTKRPQAMRNLLDRDSFLDEVDEARLRRDSLSFSKADMPRPNIALGVSIENDRYTFRADILRETPAAVRFLSLEPLLGPLPSLDLTGIDWVIVGGESGNGARPMLDRWVVDIRDRCLDANVPFFFKQWGEWRIGGSDVRAVGIDGSLCPSNAETRTLCTIDDRDHLHTFMSLVGKHAAGRVLDGRTWDEQPTAWTSAP